jgi:hypothetical protein
MLPVERAAEVTGYIARLVDQAAAHTLPRRRVG